MKIREFIEEDETNETCHRRIKQWASDEQYISHFDGQFHNLQNAICDLARFAESHADYAGYNVLKAASRLLFEFDIARTELLTYADSLATNGTATDPKEE